MYYASASAPGEAPLCGAVDQPDGHPATIPTAKTALRRAFHTAERRGPRWLRGVAPQYGVAL